MKNLFKKTIFTFLLLACFVTLTYSKEQPKGISVTKDNNGYKVEFTLPDYNMNNLLAAGNSYINLNIPEYGEPTDVGLPNLPQITFSLMIVYDEQTPTINVLKQVQDLKILGNKIYPVQQGWSKNLKLEDRPFTIDSKYYQSNGNINGPFVKVSEPFIIAGAKGVMITVCPFAYNPSTNQLMVTKKGSFKIQLKNEPSLRYTPTGSFNQLYDAMFLNYTSTKATTGTGRYLIISAPAYESGLSSFVTEKTGLGYTVTLVTTATTGATNTAIKAYIQTLYDNTSTRPEFVLLVGDVDVIPGWTGTGTPDYPYTDLNYSCLEGSDPYADVFLGRFPVQSTTQLSNMITKTLYMESAINSLAKKNVFCASSDNWAITEGTHNFVIDSFFVSSIYTNRKLYCHSDTATTAQLTAALNANQNFAIYSGHGSTTSWADGPVFTVSNVNALTNTVFPYVYSFSCLTGQFNLSECFAETWMRGSKGASIYWGSSVESYWDQDDILEKRTFRAMFIENLIKTSPSFVLGKYLLTQYYGGPTGTYMQRYLEEYNCMGDPSIYMENYAPKIVHTQLSNTENLSGPYTVNCTITQTIYPINSSTTKIYWTRGTTFTDSVLLTNSSGNNWTANIPGNGSPAVYRYYIKASDNQNFSSYSPTGAPSNYYTFTASVDTAKPVITHTAITNTPQQNWPVTVSATITDNIGIDSAYVRWYKNNTSNTKEFKLVNTSGSVYATAFNSLNADVVVGDSIFYRIIAQDNSSAHNRDSSSLYKFTITNVVTTSICRTIWLPIRDNATNYDSFQVSTNASVIKVNFTMVELVHTYDGDVTFALRSPSGTEVTLSANNGSSGDNYINTVFNDSATTAISSGSAPFTGTYKPDNVLSAFNGLSTNGWWRMRVTDDASGDTGHVRQYCVQIYSTSALVGISHLNKIPEVYSLSQNYPNPFNPVTKINFEIPKQGFVSLKIYDVLGREVRTLVSEVKSPGSYSIDFNGTELASGIYFYRFESNGFTDIKKMALIK
jgi:subtilisin-like proprotein convertase family protein